MYLLLVPAEARVNMILLDERVLAGWGILMRMQEITSDAPLKLALAWRLAGDFHGRRICLQLSRQSPLIELN